MLYFGAISICMAMELYQSHLDRLWLKVFAEIFQFAWIFGDYDIIVTKEIPSRGYY